MGEDDNHGLKYYWEKYLPCRMHRKNVVLICLTICCFALVTWTIVATIENPDAPKNANGTVEVPFVVDDSKVLAMQTSFL